MKKVISKNTFQWEKITTGAFMFVEKKKKKQTTIPTPLFRNTHVNPYDEYMCVCATENANYFKNFEIKPKRTKEATTKTK